MCRPLCLLPLCIFIVCAAAAKAGTPEQNPAQSLEQQIGKTKEAIVLLVRRSIEKNEGIAVVDLEQLRQFTPDGGGEATRGVIGKSIKVLYEGGHAYKAGDSISLYRKTRHTRLILIAGNWIPHCDDAEKLIVSTLESIKGAEKESREK